MEHGNGSPEAARSPEVVPAVPAEPPGDEPDLGRTGEPRVDAALADLHRLAGLPVAEHPPLFEQAHQRLQEVLGELDAERQALRGTRAAEVTQAGS